MTLSIDRLHSQMRTLGLGCVPRSGSQRRQRSTWQCKPARQLPTAPFGLGPQPAAASQRPRQATGSPAVRQGQRPGSPGEGRALFSSPSRVNSFRPHDGSMNEKLFLPHFTDGQPEARRIRSLSKRTGKPGPGAHDPTAALSALQQRWRLTGHLSP